MNTPSERCMTRLSTRIRLTGVALTSLSLLWAGAAQSTDLQDVYEQARQYDAEYTAAQYDLEAARQRVPLARSAFLPQLAFGAEAGLSTLADDGEGPFEETALSLSLSQTLFNRSSGKLLDQAQQGVMQAEAQYAALGQTLILRVATAYFDVLRAQAIVDFSQSELQAISRQREQAERRFDVGLVPITDVRSAQAQYDLAVAQEIAASNQLSTAQEELLRISGLNPELLAPLADDMPLVPPEPADIDAWVELAKEQNLELVIARLVRDSSLTQVEIERTSRYPTLDLVGTAASSQTDQDDRDTDIAEIKLQLSLPILTGGRVSALIAQARAQALSSGEQMLVQERATVQQTRDGYRGVQASISRVRALRQALVSTQKSAEATEAGFRAGTRTSVEVLQALRDTYSARSDYAGARYDYIINTLNLKAASGTLSEKDIYAINRFLAEPE
ncbi:MAG: TolC family outer membrane protein [Granulosicoccus sp.]|nr:TolC family outer membrane protein [Granulosicoccus sp.]